MVPSYIIVLYMLFLLYDSCSSYALRISHDSIHYHRILDSSRLRACYHNSQLLLTAKRKKSNAASDKNILSIENDDLDEADAVRVDEALKVIPNISNINNIPSTSTPMNIPSTMSTETKSDIKSIICNVLSEYNLFLKDVIWSCDRIEIITSSDAVEDISPESDKLAEVHQRFYSQLEAESKCMHIVTDYEIIIASPGIGDVLRSDRDFISFKGFEVSVTTIEPYKDKELFQGSLVGRADGHVILNLKGRLLKIPTDIVKEVRLPKPMFEADDFEIKKLR